ncbi:MAG: ribose-phosphate pyrophosphokinase [Pseudomonadales bacterium]|nr:ribose-phosphate pyrophosphokinase [Pseudomonadales bacterium]
MKNRIYCIDQNNKELVDALAGALDGQSSEVEYRRFPDGESYLRVTESCEGVNAIVVCSLQHPDEKILPLLFLADTLKELGAASVGLVAPYLCYMRQDIRFKPGETLSSKTFANLISQKFDWLVTVDPRLHRYNSLDEVYSIPSRVVSSATAIAAWIKNQVEKPLLIGPDSESDQWLSEISNLSEIPYLCLEKKRSGDRDVQVSSDELAQWNGFNPILIDDIISSGHTMLETIKYLQQAGMNAPLCIGIHALFDEQTYQLLQGSGAKVITCNTVNHHSNKIDINSAIVAQIAGIKDQMAANKSDD